LKATRFKDFDDEDVEELTKIKSLFVSVEDIKPQNKRVRFISEVFTADNPPWYCSPRWLSVSVLVGTKGLNLNSFSFSL